MIFLIYKDANGKVNVKIILMNHDLWLMQNLIAELFEVFRSMITEHINNIFRTNELNEKIRNLSIKWTFFYEIKKKLSKS